jgi:uncharacterized protein
MAFAAMGAVAFFLLGLPLPLLLGPMFACLFAALLKAPLRGVPVVSEAMRTVLGVAVGASITPELIDRIDSMAMSVAFIPLFVLAIGAIGYPYFRRLCGFDAPTAYYCAMPGGLQDMLVFGIEAGGDARALSLVHATRVLVIVSIMPMLLTWGWGLTLDHAPGSPARDIPLMELAVTLACAIFGWRIGKRIGLFGAAILGPLVLSAVASLTGLIHHRPPAEAILVAQFFIGLGVGVKYTGVTLGELRRIVAAALGYCVILAILSVAFAELVHFYAGTPQVEALLAFAPGGQGEMVVLAFVSGADLAFVVTHHLVRLIVVILGAPIAARWLR